MNTRNGGHYNAYHSVKDSVKVTEDKRYPQIWSQNDRSHWITIYWNLVYF